MNYRANYVVFTVSLALETMYIFKKNIIIVTLKKMWQDSLKTKMVNI